MARIPIPTNNWHRLILVLALIALAVLKANQMLRPIGGTFQTAAWKTYTYCTLLENPNNDGDSFDLLCEGEQLTARLYFVDCPEKRRHQHNGPRIADQARYFGCSEEQAIATGLAARDFAEDFLRGENIIFTTRMEPVFDSGRVYGTISAGGADMGEALVARGLARIFTKATDSPAPGTKHEELERLQKLEREAKANRLGGWQP